MSIMLRYRLREEEVALLSNRILSRNAVLVAFLLQQIFELLKLALVVSFSLHEVLDLCLT